MREEANEKVNPRNTTPEVRSLILSEETFCLKLLDILLCL